MALSETPIIVGKIMMPSKTDAVSIVLPATPKMFCTSGTKTTRPKKPYTTDGTPAINSVAGFKIL